MASIADLNVRIGLIASNLDKGLEQVERKLRASGRRLSQLGDDLTLSISLPLAAIGGSAIKAAGDMEALQLAMESQLGSALAARKEIEALRIEALKPGLGFEQAVRGSLQLQAVGFSAAKARETLSAFGNALALVGKGGAELAGVALALTQIQAKGVVSAEEINQIAERLPQIRSAMQAAFGTASTEEIQKLGITAQQFIDGITKELQKLPQATGGIKNALENAGQGINQFLAKIGTSISKAFDLPATAEKFSAFLQAAGDAFAGLDADTQRYIITAGAMVIALGPAAKILGVLKTSTAAGIDVIQGGISVLQSFTNTVLNSANAVGRLKLAFGIIGIVVGLATAVYTLSDRFDAATYASEKFAEAQKNITDEAAKEIAVVNQSFNTLRDWRTSQEARKRVVDQLIQQYPQYLSGLDLEKKSASELTQIQKGLNDQILRGVAERQKAAAVTAIYEKQAATLLRIQQIRDGAQTTIGEAGLIDTGDVIAAGSRAEAIIVKLTMQANELGKQAQLTAQQFDKTFGTWAQVPAAIDPALQAEYAARDAYIASRDALEENTKSTEKSIVARKSAAKATKEQKTEIELYLEKLEKVNRAEAQHQQVLSSMGLQPLATLPAPASAQQLPGTGPVAQFGLGQAVDTGIAETISPSQALFEGLSEKTITFDEAFQQMAENVQANGGVVQNAMLGMAQSVTAFAEAGGSSLSGFVNALVAGAKQAVGAYIRMGVASVVAKALASGGANPIAALALGAIAGAGAQVLFNNLISKIKIPAFAAGTNYAPGGLALVGELGPELVNLPRGSQVIPNQKVNSMLGDNNTRLSGEFTLRGEDLILSLDKARQRQQRYS